MNLTEALQKQIEFCKQHEHCRCGIYVNTSTKQNIVKELISEILPVADMRLRAGFRDGVPFDNGSIIQVVIVGDRARGYRFNSAIIDNDIDFSISEQSILPCLIPRIKHYTLSNRTLDREEWNCMKERIYYCDISLDDIENSKKRNGFKNKDELIKYIQTKGQENIGILNSNFEREYECMFEANNYDRAIVDKELNGVRVLLYEAWGIPKDKITYDTEFINKTKQTYLNIKGEYSIDDLGFENDLNVHLLIDTDIYDGFNVIVNDGMVTVELHEIENEKPELKDLSASTGVVAVPME